MTSTIDKQIINVTRSVLNLMHFSEAHYKSKALDSITDYAKTMHVTLKTK